MTKLNNFDDMVNWVEGWKFFASHMPTPLQKAIICSNSRPEKNLTPKDPINSSRFSNIATVLCHRANAYFLYYLRFIKEHTMYFAERPKVLPSWFFGSFCIKTKWTKVNY